MRKKILWVLPALLIINQACAPSRFVEPLEKGEVSVGGTFGGPVIDFGGPIPMPISTIEVGYGYDTNLTIFGALHTTAAVFGNLQLDVGISYQFLEQKKYIPNLSIMPSFNVIYNFEYKSLKFWPVLDLNAFWNYGKRTNYFYVGVNNYFELNGKMAFEQDQISPWLFSPQFGHVFKGKQENWQLTTEFKLLAPYLNNETAFVPYKSLLGTNGATAFFVGCRWILGKKNK
ncbi:MAG: hypothetical protein ACI8ZM_001340 [Crocinitomix sp.]|jgi:hypothetical protein